MDKPLQAPRRLQHVERLRILWGDMDALGHVNNVMYFRYMEQARIGMFAALVPPEQAWKSLGMVIVSTACDFKRALVYPADIEVKVFTEPPGGSSLGTVYEIAPAGEPEPWAVGRATIVFMNLELDRPTRIPDFVRARLEPAAG
jgi:acyl-CoA thioester hydrolase